MTKSDIYIYILLYVTVGYLKATAMRLGAVDLWSDSGISVTER